MKKFCIFIDDGCRGNVRYRAFIVNAMTELDAKIKFMRYERGEDYERDLKEYSSDENRMWNGEYEEMEVITVIEEVTRDLDNEEIIRLFQWTNY